MVSIINRLKNTYRLHMAVKEALDSLPTAVCYFTPDGSLKLCNTAMYEIYREIDGRELQSLSEIREALDQSCRANKLSRDGNIFLFPDGRARLYSEKQITTSERRVYIEVLFSDVTDLYRKRQELDQQSKEMKLMYAELKTLSDNIMEATREQEILNMKMHLHDQMNIGVAAIRQILRQNMTMEENVAAMGQFRRAIQILQVANQLPQDDLSEIIQDAEVSGIEMNISGELPTDEQTFQLVLAILREACVNAARHADATMLDVTLEWTKEDVILRITNDGKAPEREVTPRGGLADLRKRIMKADGRMEITSAPDFILTVILPAVR